MPPDDPSPETTCARPPDVPAGQTEPLVPPLSLSVVYKIGSLDEVDDLYEGRASGSIYARDGHPNAAMLAAKVARLERGEAALVCASGMGAEAAAFLALLESGDHVALSEGLYGKTLVLVGRELGRFGVTHSFFDPTRLPRHWPTPSRPQGRRSVFAETLSNPLVRLADIAGLAEVAHASGAALAVDHTFAPLLCRPIELGADALTHSGTKLIGGHSDLTLGLLVGSGDLIRRASASRFGLRPDGQPVRGARLALAAWPRWPSVPSAPAPTPSTWPSRLSRPPGGQGGPPIRSLASHPDHDRARRVLSGGFGTICTIDLGSRQAADSLIRSRVDVPFAPSLGDVATTLSHPATTSHRGQTPEAWARQGISPGLIRISVGLESLDDLAAEFSRALDRPTA